MIGAGTGLIFILRWFWWRINAWSEISAMFSSGIISILLNFTSLKTILFDVEDGLFPSWFQFPFVVFVTTIIWLVVTFLTPPEKDETLQLFYKNILPSGAGWRKVVAKANLAGINFDQKEKNWSLPNAILAMLLSCVLIYSCLFATGFWIYSDYKQALILTSLVIIASIFLIKLLKKIKNTIL